MPATDSIAAALAAPTSDTLGRQSEIASNPSAAARSTSCWRSQRGLVSALTATSNMVLLPPGGAACVDGVNARLMGRKYGRAARGLSRERWSASASGVRHAIPGRSTDDSTMRAKSS